MHERSDILRLLDSRHNAVGLNDKDLPFKGAIKAERRLRWKNYFDDLETSGQIEDLNDFRAFDKRRSQTRMMSIEHADRMEKLGVRGYHDGQPVSFVGLNSHTVDQIEPFRRNNSIPIVAQEKRSKLIKELIYYVEKETKKKGVKFRSWVQHDGPRCIACRLPKRWKAQNGRVTNFNESPIAKRLGAFVIMRSNEAGSPLKKELEKVKDSDGKWNRPYVLDEYGNKVRCLDEKGRQTYHPHTHMIVRLDRYLTDDEFSELIEFAQRHFKTPKLDSGALNEPREACKYPIKLSDLRGVKDIDLRRYLKFTFKKRLIAFYGDLKAQIRWNKINGKHVKAVWNPKTKNSEYRIRRNPNSKVVCKPKTAQEKIIAKLESIERMEETEEERENRGNDDCNIIAKLAPMPLRLPIREPVILARGRVQVNELLERKEIRPILEASEWAFQEALAMFEALYGVSAWDWVNGCELESEETQKSLEGANFDQIAVAGKGSAHNAPVISKSGKPKTLPAKRRGSIKGDKEPDLEFASLFDPPGHKKTPPLSR